MNLLTLAVLIGLGVAAVGAWALFVWALVALADPLRGRTWQRWHRRCAISRRAGGPSFGEGEREADTSLLGVADRRVEIAEHSSHRVGTDQPGGPQT